MSFESRLRRLRSRRMRPRTRHVALQVERLEARCLPSLTWTGKLSSDWFTAGNWDRNRAPTAQDIIEITGAPAHDPVITGGRAAGAIELDIVDFNGKLTIDTGSTLTVSHQFEQYSGTIAGGGTLNLNLNPITPSIWVGGQMGGGRVGFTNLNSGVLHARGQRLELVNRDFAIAGGAELSWEGHTLVMSRSTIFNEGGIEMASTAVLLHKDLFATAAIINNGIIAKDGPGTTTIEASFTNSGDVNVANGGLLDLTGGGASNNGLWGTTLENGIPSGVWFHAGDFTWTAHTVFDPGRVLIRLNVVGHHGGFVSVSTLITMAPQATATIDNQIFNLGTVNALQPARIVSSGGASMEFVQGSDFRWGDGAISGVDISVDSISSAEIATFQGGGLISLSDGQLSNLGNLTLGAVVPMRLIGASIFNDEGGLFVLQSGAFILGINGYQNTVINGGVMDDSNGTITNCSISNGGSWAIEGGLLNAVECTVQSSGTLLIGGGSELLLDQTNDVTGILQINGGTLTGLGTVGGNVNNRGTVLPGGALIPGTFTITGWYRQWASGTLGIVITGQGAGAAAAKLAVGGQANLQGTLDLFTSSYTPTVGDTFTILSSSQLIGDFATINTLQLGGGLRFKPDLSDGKNYKLVVANQMGAAPNVTGISVASGPTTGGTVVTISGSNFTGAFDVSFGGVPANSFTINSDTSITATSPPHASGTVDITVANAFGTSSTSSADQFTYLTSVSPAITSISPSSGSTLGGTVVDIRGSGFTGVTGVNFGSVAASFTFISDTEVVATSPAQSAGTVDVRVTTYAGTSPIVAADQFTYVVSPVPSVTGVSPVVGDNGCVTQLTITGSGFTGLTAVLLGGVFSPSFTVNSNTSITAAVPAQVSGGFDVIVVGPGGTSPLSAGDRFGVANEGAPNVTSVTPSSGTTAGGTVVTITGTGFSDASSVQFGSFSASSYTVNSDTQISAVAPPQTAATVDIVVTTPSGTSSKGSADHFTYTSGSSPTISGVSPNSGTTGGGTLVTISGAAFTGATAVSFGSVAATSFVVLSDSSVVAKAPPQAAGTVDIKVTTPAGTSAAGASDHFTYTAAAVPSVTGLTPNIGYTTGGTTVEISGSGFTGASNVSFGGVAATFFAVLSDASILATAPAAVAAGTVDVTVTTYSGTSTTSAADHFTYNAVPVPTLTAVSPTSGSTGGGTIVTLTGTGFTNATAVYFANFASTDFVVNSDTQITAASPAQYAGTVDITVVSAGGTSATSSSDRFTYNAASTPAVSSLGTTSGTTAGGTSVTITGTNFTGAFGVNFGTIAATSFVVNSDTSITAISPPQVAGTYDVTVTTYTGTSASTSSDQFTVTAASVPVVNSLGTTSGTTGGGTLVGITGLHFTGATAVNFGSVAATSFVVNSDTSITAFAPAQAAATVDVTVATYAGTSATGSADHYTYTAASAPSVTSITPTSGTTPGGTQVTILGSNFSGATQVMFGSVAASGFTVNSDSSITATAPPEAAGTVDIKVTTYSGTSATGAADQFTYTNITEPTPAVTAVSPNTGSTAGGQVVTITGTSFSGATAVKFGTTAATSFTINSDTQITATAPAGSAGTVDITVTTNNGTSSTGSADHFTYQSTGAPTVTSLGTTTGTTAGGTSVVINGTNFSGATAVMFGSFPAASFTVNSSTKITATSPAEPVGTVDVTVTTPSGTSATSSSDQFTYTAASLPTVTSLSPTSGSTAGGTSVTITGTNFTGATAVYFGSFVATSFTVNSSTQITATSPAQYAGTIDVTVSTYAGTSATASGDRFTYTSASAPTVTSLSPTSGTTAGGTSVTITGTNFTGATAVMFGNVAAASFTVNSSTSITAISPAQAAGTVDVKVTTFTGTSASGTADHFTYSAAAVPTVTGVSPNSGTTGGGTSVTVTGTGFTGATAVNFGSVAATSFTVNSDTSITATSPSEAAGTVDVTVTTYSGTSATGASDHFTYNAASAPSVTGVSPSSGSAAGGTVVTITGSAFTGASAVNFGTAAAVSFTIISDTSIVATAPAGTAGTVDITVTTPTGTSATGAADHFTYTAVAAPTITSLNPSTGPTGGGTLVTITGTGFLNARGVSFGTTSARIIIVSDSSIVATAPPEPAGTIDVTVSAYGTVSAFTGADRYTYTAALAPSVTSIGPTSGSTAGGTSVTITGSAFTGASGVIFGGVAATNFTVNSDTSITATSPAEAAGTVDIVVSSPTGTSAVSASDHFTYTAAAAPSVTGVSPNSGSTAGGTVVTITGSGFTGVSAVNFGSVAAAFTFNSDTRITATAPAQAAGTVDITVVTPSGTSATGASDHFTYTAAAAPSVTGVTPSSGSTAGGTLVTVTGSGFTGASAVNFGATAATSYTVLSDTALTAVAPAESAATIDITVVTPSGTSATGAADHFTYTAPSAPTVTAVSPTSGSTAGGTVVTITGTNFTGATGVNFGSYAASSFTINSATQLTAVTPPQAAGTVDVTITTIAGTSATGASDHFTYNAASAPTVTAVSPNSGPTGGGVNVAITGTGFTGATAVKFGSVAATSFVVNSDTSIFAVAPAEAAGTVDVTVTTYAGTSSTGTADHFSYVADYSLSATGANVNAVAGVLFSGQIATFTDSDPSGGSASQFCAVISWGDGHYSVGTVGSLGNGGYSVGGSNTYAAAGTYTVTVQINDVGGATASTTATARVTAPHAATSALQSTGTQATATANILFTGIVASLTDAADSGPASHFTTTITWGDGNTSSGTVTPNESGGWDVSGKDTYAQAGTYTVTVSITDSKSNKTTATSTITVVGGGGGAGPLLVAATSPSVKHQAASDHSARNNALVTSLRSEAQPMPWTGTAISTNVSGGHDELTASATLLRSEPSNGLSDKSLALVGGGGDGAADAFWQSLAPARERKLSLGPTDAPWLPDAVVDELFVALGRNEIDEGD